MPDQQEESTAPAVEPIVVFVVEDEILIRELVKASLMDAGYRVIEASNGEQAMAILDKPDSGAIRALVTDIDLGGKVSGWNLARRARELNPNLAIVYMTGASGDPWAASGAPNSILVTKPFAPAQIVTAVSQLFNAVPQPPS